MTIDSTSNYNDNNDKEDEIEYEENEAGEMVVKRKNPGPWKVTEPAETIPIPKGTKICKKIKFIISKI